MMKKTFKEKSSKLIQTRMGQIRPEKEYLTWTTEEKEEFKIDYRNGVGISELALKYQRSEDAVFGLIKSMDLDNRKDNPRRIRKGRKETFFPNPSVCLSNACPHYDTNLCIVEQCTNSKEVK